MQIDLGCGYSLVGGIFFCFLFFYIVYICFGFVCFSDFLLFFFFSFYADSFHSTLSKAKWLSLPWPMEILSEVLCVLFWLWFFGVLSSSLLWWVETERFGRCIPRHSSGVPYLSGHRNYLFNLGNYF